MKQCTISLLKFGVLFFFKQNTPKCSKLNMHTDIPVTDSPYIRINKELFTQFTFYTPPVHFATPDTEPVYSGHYHL